MFTSAGAGAPDIDAMMRQAKAMQQQQASGVALPVPGMNGRKEAQLPDGTKVVLEMNTLTMMGPQGGTSKLLPAPIWDPSAPKENNSGFELKMHEKAGPTCKLSYRPAGTGTRGRDLWQDRELKLDGSTLLYFKPGKEVEQKSVDLSTATIGRANKGDQRFKDCWDMKHRNGGMIAKLTQPMSSVLDEYRGTVEKDFCMTVQREKSINAMMGGAKAAMGQSPMNMAFGGGAKQLRKDMEEAGSRTWYFSFETAVERDAWVQSCSNNGKVHQIQTSGPGGPRQEPFKSLIKRAGGNCDDHDLASILDTLYV